MWKWHEMAKQNVCDFENGGEIQNLIWHLRDACDKTKALFSSSPKKPSNSTSSPRRNSYSVRLHRSTRSSRKIQRFCVGSEDKLQVAVVERGTTSQRRLLQRLDVFKASGTEANLLGNQYWRLHLLQNGVWVGVGVEHREIWCAPIPNSGLDRQRSQKNLGWSSTQVAKGWNQSLGKSWKQKENRNRLPILVGL